MSRDKFLFIILLIISFILFIGKPEQRIKKADFLSKTVFLPYVNSIHSFKKINALHSENRALMVKNSKLMLEMLKLRDMYQKVSGKPFTDSKESDDVKTIIADVIGYTGNYWERSLIINSGFSQGIEVGNPVATSEGIVGKISTVSAFQSTILPLTNYRFQMPVKLSHNSVQGVIETDLLGVHYMNYIKTGSPIGVADTVVVSNLSKQFPKYYPVGTIKSITDSKDNLYLSAEVEPFNIIDNLKTVYILKEFKGNDDEQEESGN